MGDVDETPMGKKEKRREEALKRERNTASSKLACSNQRRSP